MEFLLLGARDRAVQEVVLALYLVLVALVQVLVCDLRVQRVAPFQSAVLEATCPRSHIVEVLLASVDHDAVQIGEPLPLLEGHVELLLLGLIFENALLHHHSVALQVLDSYFRVNHARVDSEVPLHLLLVFVQSQRIVKHQNFVARGVEALALLAI